MILAFQDARLETLLRRVLTCLDLPFQGHKLPLEDRSGAGEVSQVLIAYRKMGLLLETMFEARVGLSQASVGPSQDLARALETGSSIVVV